MPKKRRLQFTTAALSTPPDSLLLRAIARTLRELANLLEELANRIK
jgi:hypothetical protein